MRAGMLHTIKAAVCCAALMLASTGCDGTSPETCRPGILIGVGDALAPRAEPCCLDDSCVGPDVCTLHLCYVLEEDCSAVAPVDPVACTNDADCRSAGLSDFVCDTRVDASASFDECVPLTESCGLPAP